MMLLYIAAGIGAAMILLWILSRNSDPRRQIQIGERALDNGNTGGARTRFLRAVELMESGKGKPEEREELVAKAHLAVAEIERSLGNRDNASNHFREAKSHGAELPTEAVLLLAEFFAEKQDSSEEAVAAYLTYLALGSQIGAFAECVYSTLQTICKVTEDMKPTQRKPAAELNRRVIAVNPRLEWAHYHLALACLLDGHANEAIEQFGQASRLNPSRPLTFYWLTVSYLHLPTPALIDAIDALEKFLSFRHDDPRTRKRETKVCAQIAKRLIESIGSIDKPGQELDAHQLASLDRAIHYLEEAVERVSEDATIHFDLGRAYRMRGVRAKAEEAFRRASVLSPGEKTYSYELGIECSALGRTEDAVQALERAVKLSPEYEVAHDALGDIYYNAQDYQKAAQHLESALGAGTRNPLRFSLFVRSCYRLGDFARIVGKVDQRKADPSPFNSDADAAYAVGRSYSIVGRPADAIVWLQKVGTSPEARYFLACAHAGIGQYPEALTLFEGFGDTAGEWSYRAAVQQAHILRKQGDAEQAKSLYRKVEAADRNNFEAIRALGEIALVQGELAEAISRFSAAAVLKPKRVEISYELGVALERSGELDQALYQYLGATEGESHARASLRIGVIRCRMGQFAEAIQSFDSCEQEANRPDVLLFYRGLAFAGLGKCQPAIRDWAELEQRHPTNERLRLNLARARYLQGSQALSQGTPEEAIENWELYLDQYSMDENASRDVAELHFRSAMELIRKETPDAVQAVRTKLRAAIQRDPGNGTFRLLQALFDVHCGVNIDDAVAKVRALAAEDPQDPNLLYHLGWCLLQSGQSSEAMKLFDSVRHMPNGSDYARYASWALSNAMISESNYEDAFNVLTATTTSDVDTSREAQP